MSNIELSGIHKYYGNAHVLKDVNLNIEDGDFMTLLGPSGCGKTTTLRIISGLENPEKGSITIAGKQVVSGEELMYMPPSTRGLDLVFQSYALWPHMTVFNNVAFGLQLKKMPKKEIVSKVERALSRMHIHQYKDRYPNELSGGQQQRVAIARAIVSETQILLLDEPLSNLDAKLRIEMRSELKRLHKELGTTVVYVTHDQTEALTMSTKIALFFDGVLVQCDKPMVVYRNPATIQVADFIGNPKINFLDGKVIQTGNDSITIDCPLGNIMLSGIKRRIQLLQQHKILRVESSGNVVLAVRPEHIKFYDCAEEAYEDIRIEATNYSDMPAGSETLVQLVLSDGTSVIAKCLGERELKMNQKLYLGIESRNINIYDKESGKAIFGMDDNCN